MEEEPIYFHLIDGRTGEVDATFCVDGPIEYRYDPDSVSWIMLKGHAISLMYHSGETLLDRVSFDQSGLNLEAPSRLAA